MKTPVLICSIFALAVTAAITKSENAIADSYPAFTAAMVDAAAMAFGLTPFAYSEATAGDDPDAPSIFCTIAPSSGDNKFELDVNDSVPVSAHVHGVHKEEGGDLNTELFSYVEDLSLSQMRACRKVILKSFVWKNYCAPALP